MAYRNGGGGGRVEFDDRDSIYIERPSRRPALREEDIDLYGHREERRSQSRAPPVRERERERERERDVETDIDIHVRERDRERDRESRVPNFMREAARRAEPGPLVLRQREVETIERPRRRSPSPPHRPPPRREDDVHVRLVERERVRSPSRGPPLERVRTRVVERERDRSPSPTSPPPVMERVRIVGRRRPSPSPVDREREEQHIRIVDRERARIPSPSPSPSPSPPPQVIRGPIIEREVITHYRDIDHGMLPAPRPPSPPPPPRRPRERDTEIDIYTSRNATEVDIHKSSSHSRTRERSRSRERPAPQRLYDDEHVARGDRHRLEVDIEQHSARRPRAHSAAPPVNDYDDEADYILGRINERGRMGEAWGGATKDWTMVDVPPGTERVRMDGVGGASAEVSWQRYNGSRRTKFLPEREAGGSTSSEREERPARPRDSRLSVQIYDTDGRGDRERDIEVEKITDRRISAREPEPPAPAPALRRSDLWTEVTKDLILREAIEETGYEYEETEKHFYVMEYLKYEDVLRLVRLSDAILRSRKDRVREVQWEREVRDGFDRDRRDRRRRGHHRHAHSVDRFEDEHVYERETEVVYDRAAPVRGHVR